MAEELHMYCVVRCDLRIPVPKLLVQAGHAYVSTAWIAMDQDAERFRLWFDAAQAKIVLRANTLQVLLRAKAECEQADIPCYLVTDAGRTVFPEPTITCLGIGPVLRSELPNYVARLQLLHEKDLASDEEEAEHSEATDGSESAQS